MDPHSLELLEFSKILGILSEYTSSPEGLRRVLQTEPFTDQKQVEREQLIIGDATRLIERRPKRPSLYFPDLDSLINSLQDSFFIADLERLHLAASYLRSYGLLRDYFLTGLESRDGLYGQVKKFHSEGLLIEPLERILDKEGRLKEKKIPELRRIKEAMTDVEAELDGLVSSYLKNGKSYWRSDKPSLHEGRLVLSVKASAKRQVPGAVLRSSSTGETVYIEPPDILDRNNTLVELESEYHRVLMKILDQTTKHLRTNIAVFQQTREHTGRMDEILARVLYGKKIQGILPRFLPGRMLLKEARHPLLKGKVVPIDVEITDENRLIVLSGPNTGGKTVALKMIGLMALMAQSCIPVPINEDSELRIFDKILVSIGDEQSIEKSLSTFSSFIQRLVFIQKEMSPDSLILIDELGSGTDPDDGGALSIVLLEEILSSRAYALITTHLGSIKRFAFSQEGAINASAAFDGEAFAPVYRIQTGIPGESHALAIAERCGMSKKFIERAQKIKPDQTSTAFFMQIAKEKSQLAQKELEYEKRLASLEENEKKSAEKEQHLREKELELREEGIVEIKEAIKSVHNQMNLSAYSSGIAQPKGGLVDVLRQEKKQQSEKIQEMQKDLSSHFLGTYKKGDWVMVNGTKGQLVTLNKKGEWTIQMGNLSLIAPEYSLIPVGEEQTDKGQTEQTLAEKKQSSPKTKALVDIDLSTNLSQASLVEDFRGMRLEEALSHLEKKLDQVILADTREFSIIHGTGEGILSRGIREYLKTCPWVESFKFANQKDGGAGRTDVRLK